MNAFQQRMCERQADVFEQSIERFKCSSSYFVFRFMRSSIAKQMDTIENNVDFYSVNNILLSLEKEAPSINTNEGEKYPVQVMRWIGYIYRAWAILKHRSSLKLYKYLKCDKLLSLYDSFHTYSVEYCVDCLEKIVNENKDSYINEYELYKSIVLEQKR